MNNQKKFIFLNLYDGIKTKRIDLAIENQPCSFKKLRLNGGLLVWVYKKLG